MPSHRTSGQWVPLIAALWVSSLFAVWWGCSSKIPEQPIPQSWLPDPSSVQPPDPSPRPPFFEQRPDPGVAIEAYLSSLAGSFPNPERDRNFLAILESCNSAQLEALDAKLTEYEANGDIIAWERITLWHHWTGLCPASALDYAMTDPVRSGRAEEILTVLASANLPAVVAWLKTQKDCPQWKTLSCKVLSSISRRNVEEAVRCGLDLASGQETMARDLFPSIAKAAIESGQLEDATDVLHRLANGKTETGVLHVLATAIRDSLRSRSSDEAAAWENSQKDAAWQSFPAGTVAGRGANPPSRHASDH